MVSGTAGLTLPFTRVVVTMICRAGRAESALGQQVPFGKGGGVRTLRSAEAALAPDFRSSGTHGLGHGWGLDGCATLRLPGQRERVQWSAAGRRCHPALAPPACRAGINTSI